MKAICFNVLLFLLRIAIPVQAKPVAYLSSARDAVSGDMVPSQCADDGLARGPVETFLGEFKDDS